MNPVLIALIVLVVIVVVVTGSQYLGWRCIGGGRYAHYPFSWRIFLGPWAYKRWLKRTGMIN